MRVAFIVIVSLQFIMLEGRCSLLAEVDSVDYMSLFNKVRRNNLDSAEIYAQMAVDQGYVFGDSLLILRAATAKAWVLEQKGDYTGAVNDYEQALKIARNNGYRSRTKFILNRLGLTHADYANYSEALRYHLESLKLREEDEDLVEIATASNNIGLVYYRISDYGQAIQYYETAIELGQNTNLDLKTTLANLGLCHTALGQDDKALGYYERVLELCNEDCSADILVIAYHGSGLSYLNNDQEKAQKNFEKAIEISKSNELFDKLVIGLHYLSKIELKNGNIDTALEIVNESQKMALAYGYRRWVKLNFQQLGAVFSSLGNFEQAYNYQRKYDSLNNEILNEGIVKNMAKIQADYQERENLQTIQNQDQEISRTNTLLFLSVIIIILISIILFILYRINELRRRANRQLSEAKNTIEQQNNILEEKVRERTKELNETNAALMKSNTDLDNFIYKTSHDIRGPLATLQGMCNVALIDIEDNKSRDYFEKIGHTAFRLNEILSKLLIINQINNSLISTDKVDLKKLVKGIIKENSALPGYREIKVENQIDQFENIESDEVLLKIILGNLISNAYKFHNSSNRVNSWIKLEGRRENGHLQLDVIDNGIGVDDKASSKIFEIFSKASEVSDTAGLGLYLVKLAVEKLQGKIEHSKTEEGFTKFSVELPAN